MKRQARFRADLDNELAVVGEPAAAIHSAEEETRSTGRDDHALQDVAASKATIADKEYLFQLREKNEESRLASVLKSSEVGAAVASGLSGPRNRPSSALAGIVTSEMPFCGPSKWAVFKSSCPSGP